MKKWAIGEGLKNVEFCANTSTFVKHNFENPIKMSHHIRFSPRQHFAWNGWTLYGSNTTKGGCDFYTKLNIGWFYSTVLITFSAICSRSLERKQRILSLFMFAENREWRSEIRKSWRYFLSYETLIESEYTKRTNKRFPQTM